MAGCCLMHPAHTADTRADLIFIHNGAPQALVGCQGSRGLPRPFLLPVYRPSHCMSALPSLRCRPPRSAVALRHERQCRANTGRSPTTCRTGRIEPRYGLVLSRIVEMSGHDAIFGLNGARQDSASRVVVMSLSDVTDDGVVSSFHTRGRPMVVRVA